MRNLEKAQFTLIGGADGEPEPLPMIPTQSPQDIQNILDQVHNIYHSPGTV